MSLERYTAVLALIGGLGAAQAQTTLELTGNLPQVNDAFPVRVAPYRAQPAAGSVLFDMSAVTSTGARNYTFLAANAAAVFNGPELCLVNDAYADTIFYNTNAEGLIYAGEIRRINLLNQQVEAPVGQGFAELMLPLELGDDWSGNHSHSWTSNGDAASRQGTHSGSADAVGELLLPGSTVRIPVLRVTTTVNEVIQAGGYSLNHKRRVHSYYHPGLRFPLLRAVGDTLSVVGLSQTRAELEWLDNGMSVETLESGAFGLGIFPNPASDRVELDHLAFGERMSLQVFDQQGGLVYTEELGVRAAGMYRHVLAVNAWPAGTYMVRLSDAAGRVSNRKLVVVR